MRHLKFNRDSKRCKVCGGKLVIEKQTEMQGSIYMTHYVRPMELWRCVNCNRLWG